MYIFEIHIATSTLIINVAIFIYNNDDKRDGFRKLRHLLRENAI